MKAEIILSLSPLELACIRIAVSSLAAGIRSEYKDKDCSSMNEYQECVLSLSDKLIVFSKG